MQVVCKSSAIIYIVVGGLLCMILFPFLFLMMFSPSSFSTKQVVMLVLCILALGVLLMSVYPNYRLIFDDLGITVLRKIRFFSLTLYNSELHIPWKNVMELDLPFTALVKFGVMFYTITNYKALFVPVSPMVTNSKLALDFAVTKIPPEKITKEARLKLKKKYGIIVE